MISKKNLILFGKIFHYTALKFTSPVDWDFQKNNVFTSPALTSKFRICRFLCIFNFIHIALKTMQRQFTGPIQDFYILWVFTILYTTHIVHVACIVVCPRKSTDALAEILKILRHFDGR